MVFTFLKDYSKEKKEVIETICGPQSLKDLLFGPFPGTCATSGRQERAGHSGLHGSGAWWWPGALQLCSLLNTSSPSQAWPLRRGPHSRPGLSGGPTSLALSMAPQGRSCQQTRVLQTSSSASVPPTLRPRPADAVPGLLPAQPLPRVPATELCGPELGAPSSGPQFLHVLGQWV